MENTEQTEEQQAAVLPPIESVEEFSCIIQALVFASTEDVTIKKLKEVLGDFLDQAQVSNALRHANEQLAKIKAPFEIVEVAGIYRFRTKNAYYPYIRKLFPDNKRRLSLAALETLAIIAYKQPITKAGIEAIRGVSCDGPLHNLLDKKFIALGHRAEKAPGNPYTYETTTEFLKYFGINRIPDDLPRLTEFNDILNSDFLIPQYPLQKQISEPSLPQETTQQLEIPLEEE